MVKIHFLQKFSKNGLVSEKKIKKIFHNRGGEGGRSGPYVEFSIIDFIFFGTLPLADRIGKFN